MESARTTDRSRNRIAVKKRNQIFQYMEALFILMVIDDHMSTRIGILSSIFPYNSFYMPAFVFISGYFFREQPVLKNIKHKIHHLLIPYFIWFIVGEVFSLILKKAGIVNWYVSPFSIQQLIHLFTIDSLTSSVGASWFVIMIFWVSVSYNFIHYMFQLDKKKNSYIFLLISCLIGFIDLKLCMLGYSRESMASLFLLRTLWYLQFYHLGGMFHSYWEKHVMNWRTLYSCVVCVTMNVIIVCFMKDKINFFSTAEMGSFNSWWIPLLTSITGTLFWYKIAQLLSSKVGQVNIIDFIAENTFTIMCCHLMFLNVPNFYAYYQYLHQNTAYMDFPANQFIHGAWVRYSPNTRLIGYFCGLVGSLVIAWVIQKAKNIMRTKAL